jgi:hypothetical protein
MSRVFRHIGNGLDQGSIKNGPESRPTTPFQFEIRCKGCSKALDIISQYF